MQALLEASSPDSWIVPTEETMTPELFNRMKCKEILNSYLLKWTGMPCFLIGSLEQFT